MQVLGHSQISLTLGTYSHVVAELATEAAQRVGSAVWGPTETTTETSTLPEGERSRRSRRSTGVGRQGLEP